jgi:hypothetical protein
MVHFEFECTLSSILVNTFQNFLICFFGNPTKAKTWYKKYRTILKEDPKRAAKLLIVAPPMRSLVKENSGIEEEIMYLQHNRNRSCR